MIMSEVLFWISGSALLYVFLGYPLFLLVLGKLTRRPPVLKDTTRMRVTLIISAYNEERVIEEKIRNSLALDYPREMLEIVVVSDASTDTTDDIVRRYATQGVVLQRMLVRKGKTAGLNEVVPIARGEIIVFSDANALYARDAVKKLVKNFGDPTVGCVTGNSCYRDPEASNAGKSENTYWGYERFLKMKESQIGSMVGSDGAIFAIRKDLASPLGPDDINDFVTPLQVVKRGYRNVFEPEALCYESVVTQIAQEFRRKVRIISRSWHGLFRVKELLNPRRYGLFSFQLVSHKVLRWLTPFFLSGLLLSSIFLAWDNGMREIIMWGQVVFYSVGAVALILDRAGMAPRWISFPGYFIAVNAASAVGTIRYLCGKKIIIWEPERSLPLSQQGKRRVQPKPGRYA
jgi:cellulose synthase/poly-beta-1,6-N-acetylglucosamine synthase-like glycosyltransferase